MAEFDISIDLDDEELFGSIEAHVESAIDEKMDDFDISDAISDAIWNFRQWDEIIEKEVMRNIDNWGLAVTHDLDDILDTRIENLLRDFVITSSESRCGVGKAFADAATHMIEEYVEGPRFDPAGSCKCEDMTAKLTQIMAIFEGTVKEMHRTLEGQ